MTIPSAHRAIRRLLLLSLGVTVSDVRQRGVYREAAGEIRRVLVPGGGGVIGYPRVDRLMQVLFRGIGFKGQVHGTEWDALFRTWAGNWLRSLRVGGYTSDQFLVPIAMDHKRVLR